MPNPKPITRDALLAELEKLTKADDPVPDGFRTRAELKRDWGIGDSVLTTKLAALNDAGVLAKMFLRRGGKMTMFYGRKSEGPALQNPS